MPNATLAASMSAANLSTNSCTGRNAWPGENPTPVPKSLASTFALGTTDRPEPIARATANTVAALPQIVTDLNSGRFVDGRAPG